MRIPRIYTKQSLQPNASIALEAGPSHHIARALRMSEGDKVRLFNGEGGEFLATLSEVGKKSVQVSTFDHQPLELETPLRIELGIAISRGDRMDWVIQKATELGVASIAPLTSERTEVKLKGDRAHKKLQHWRQITISACEQCGRNRLPVLHPLASLESWIGGVEAERKFVLHHRDTGAEKSSATPSDVAVLIGPEGGLSLGEISAAGSFGFEALTLGPRILRTETAPLAALAILQARWGDMSLEVPA
jgi:16S rRNA (uracil1498-N3)-methyltransferase